MMDKIYHWILLLGISGLIIVRTLVSGLVYPVSNYIFLIWIIFLYFVWFLKSISRGACTIHKTPVDLLTVLFLCICLLSWFKAINPYDGIHLFMNLLTASLFYFLVVNVIHTEKEILGLVAVLLVTGCIISIYGIYQGFFGLDETRSWVESHLNPEKLSYSFKNRLTSPRIFSTLVYPNTLAGYLLLIIPLTISTLFIGSRTLLIRVISISFVVGSAIFILFEKTEWIWAVALSSILYPILYLFAFLMTLSKGGFVALFFMQILAFIFFYHWSQSSHKKKFLGIFLIFELSIIGLLIFYREYLISMAWPSLKVRFEYWQSALSVISDFPLFGTGPGTFGSIYAKYKLPGAEETRMVHNNFLQVAAESGIASACFFTSIFLVVLVQAFKSPLSNRTMNLIRMGSFLGILSFLIHSLVDFDLYEPAVALNVWTVLALLHLTSSNPKIRYTLKMERHRTKFIWMVAAQLIAIACILGLRRPYQSDKFFYEAMSLKDEGRLTEASAWVDKSVALNFLNPQAHFLKGSIHEAKGEWKEALQHYEKALSKDPYNSHIPFRMAGLCWKLMRSGETKYSSLIEIYLKRAIENYPSKLSYHLKLAQHYESLGRHSEALVEYGIIKQLTDEKQSKDNASLQKSFVSHSTGRRESIHTNVRPSKSKIGTSSKGEA